MDNQSIPGMEQLAQRKVLVTGATGFIGSHLVARLAGLNAQVLAMGPGMGARPLVKHLVEQGRVRFIKLAAFWSAAALERVRADFAGVEAVVHLAYVMPRGKNQSERTLDDLRRNVFGTLQLISLLPGTVKKLVFASSCMVYGANTQAPVSESTPARPASPYGCGKFATENYLRLFASENGASLTILRLATVYGPYETDPRAIPNFIRHILAGKSPLIYGDGNDVRDYVHVSDVVQAIILALCDHDCAFDILNIGSGEGHSTRAIAEKLIKIIGKDTEPIYKQRNEDAQKIICDITHARQKLGYTPKIDLENGLSNEISFFSENPRFWRKI